MSEASRWTYGGHLFGTVAEALLNEEASEDLTRLVLDNLLGAIQALDYDIDPECLDRFDDNLVVRSVFYQHGQFNRLPGGDATGRLAFDRAARQWLLRCDGCGSLGSADFTAEGHDGLVHEWARHARLNHSGGHDLATAHLIHQPHAA